MKRGKQTLLFVLCSGLLIGIHGWVNNFFSSKETALEAYANVNHMGKAEALLLEKGTRDGILLLSNTERGMVYLTVKEQHGMFSRQYKMQTQAEEGWAFFENGVAVIHIPELEELYGYAEKEEIHMLRCYTGEDSHSCEVMTLVRDANGLFSEAKSLEETIPLSGMLYQPKGGVHGFGFGSRRIYAVEGLNEKGESVYWFSKYGFEKQEFAEKSLTKKIYERVVNVE